VDLAIRLERQPRSTNTTEVPGSQPIIVCTPPSIPRRLLETPATDPTANTGPSIRSQRTSSRPPSKHLNELCQKPGMIIVASDISLRPRGCRETRQYHQNSRAIVNGTGFSAVAPRSHSDDCLFRPAAAPVNLAVHVCLL